VRRYTRLEAVWYCSGVRCEHQWAATIGGMPGAAMLAPGLGSSDCGREAHLYWFPEPPTATELRGAIGVEAAPFMDRNIT